MYGCIYVRRAGLLLGLTCLLTRAHHKHRDKVARRRQLCCVGGDGDGYSDGGDDDNYDYNVDDNDDDNDSATTTITTELVKAPWAAANAATGVSHERNCVSFR